MITPVKNNVDVSDANIPAAPPIKNIVIIAISVGNAAPGNWKHFMQRYP